MLVMWRLGVKGQNVLVLWRLFGLLMRENRCWRWLFHCEPVRGPLICRDGACAGRLRRRYPPCQAAGTSLAALPAQLPRCYRRCYRRCYEWQRMTPSRRAFHECRMQFPRHCVSPRNRIVGIATFADTVESSFNRIACETAPSASCLRSSPRTWIRWHARQRRPGAYLGVEVRVAGLTRIVSGSCASDTPGGAVASTTQTTLPTTPHCRRLLPRWSATWAPRCPEARPH